MLYSKKNKKNISYLNDRVKKLFKTNLSLIFKIIYGQHVSRHSKLHLSLEVERIRSFSFTNGSAKQLCLTLQCWRVRFLEPVSTKDWPFVTCLKIIFIYKAVYTTYPLCIFRIASFSFSICFTLTKALKKVWQQLIIFLFVLTFYSGELFSHSVEIFPISFTFLRPTRFDFVGLIPIS